MNRITIVGETNPNGGYGQHAYEMVRGSVRRGIFPAFRPLKTSAGTPAEFAQYFVHTVQPEPVEVLVALPTQAVTPGKKTLFVTAWESTELPYDCVQSLNRATAIIVPSSWNLTGFMDSGIHAPIHVVPLGFDPEIFTGQPMNIDGPCVFGAAGNLYNGIRRKGLYDVIECFQRVFKGVTDVKLKVKVIGSMFPVEDDRIEISDKILTGKQLADWFASINCFASFARGEGFGLLQLQAMACSRPVIAAIYGGLREFMDEATGYSCSYSEVDAEERWAGCGQWCEPSMEHFESLMERVYTHRSEAMIKGLGSSQRVSHLTWDRTVDLTIESTIRTMA